MGEKGIPLDTSSMDALMELARAAKEPRAVDPVHVLNDWPLQTIQDAVRDTPELANRWMEAYLNWRQIRGTAADLPGDPAPPGAPRTGQV